MRILTRDNVILGGAEKKLFAKVGKEADLKLLDNQIDEKKSELKEVKSKLSKAEEKFDVKQNELELVEKKLNTLNLPFFEDKKSKLLNQIENLEAKLHAEQEKLNYLSNSKKELTLEINGFKAEKSILVKEVVALNKEMLNLKDDIRSLKEKSAAEVKEYKEKKAQQSQELDEALKKTQEILKSAHNEAEKIISKAETEAQESILKTLGHNDLLKADNYALEITNEELLKKNKELVLTNKKEEEKVGKGLVKLEKDKAEFENKVLEIERIKQDALNEIYRTAKKYKINKISDGVKKLL